MTEAETKEAHTPGPWVVHGRSGPTQPITVGRAETGPGWTVCRVLKQENSGDCCWADARLIAAAPTMLEALRSAEDELRRCGLDCVDSDERTATLLTEIRAAITRAEAQ